MKCSEAAESSGAQAGGPPAGYRAGGKPPGRRRAAWPGVAQAVLAAP
jgi:hypothetical protein